jgi:hypothetical protein
MADNQNIEASESIASHAPFTAEVQTMVRQALQGLRFGQVILTLQDGVVVQVERTERKRLRKSEH